jgi:hypothetical protein
VSNEALLSPWVAVETLKAFSDEELSDQRKFAACYVDPDFLDANFALQAAKQIDAKLAEIEETMHQHMHSKVDFSQRAATPLSRPQGEYG